MTTPADSWITHPAGTGSLLSRHFHGSLDAIADSERRALRSIGASAHEVATRTGVLLTDLLAAPDVRIFQGVRPTAADKPRIPHAISSGSRVVLVESVAWPPGEYDALPTGRIYCDGVYIGQSVRPLTSAVRHWRSILPRGHWVSALVIVHPTADGRLVLPRAQARDLAWACACDAVRVISASLPAGQQAASVRAVAALVAATAEEEIR